MAQARYHHGALREALVRVGLELARERGAEAVVLREATRLAGVTARAAYRHFADRDALVLAVGRQALALMGERIVTAQAGATRGADLLQGVGSGYIGFALDEPGWFDVAALAMPNFVGGSLDRPPVSAMVAGAASLPATSPYQLLANALAALVMEGALAPAEVTDAAVVCWSGVHGFALLATRGALRGAPRDLLDSRATRLVATLVAAVATSRG